MVSQTWRLQRFVLSAFLLTATSCTRGPAPAERADGAATDPPTFATETTSSFETHGKIFGATPQKVVVFPLDNLVDGQELRISGAGFGFYGSSQPSVCAITAKFPNGWCDSADYPFFEHSWPHGSFGGTLAIHRLVTLDDNEGGRIEIVDCATTPCQLRTLEATFDLSFASSPPPPMPTLTITSAMPASEGDITVEGSNFPTAFFDRTAAVVQCVATNAAPNASIQWNCAPATVGELEEIGTDGSFTLTHHLVPEINGVDCVAERQCVLGWPEYARSAFVADILASVPLEFG